MRVRQSRVLSVQHYMQPVRNAKRGWVLRDAALLELTGENGLVGLGEAAPLPGYSVDDFASCRRALSSIDWPDFDLGEGVETVLDRARQLVPATLPAARFAIECAVLDLAAKEARVPAWSLLSPSARPVPLSALVDDDCDVASASDRGLRTIKVKIGPADLDERLEWTQALAERFAVRLDANRSLPVEDLPRVARTRCEFVEEPCAPEVLLSQNDLGLAIAFDEALARPGEWNSVRECLDAGRVAAFCLKPMAVGGILRSLELAREARRAGVPAYASHIFGGPIAHAGESTLALVLGEDSIAAGLDRHAGIAAWGPVELPLLGPDRLLPRDTSGIGVVLPAWRPGS